MKTFNFYNYLPQRYAAIESDTEKVRNLVYNFKDGQKSAAIFVASQVVSLLWKWYGCGCKDITIVCCPSSSASQYKKRFSYFSAVVANHCMAANAMKHVEIIGKREALHRTADHVVRDNANYRINLDAEFFKGRNVIIFDDLITSGATSENFAAQLTAAGANVLGGLFLARTMKGISKRSKWGKFAENNSKIMAQYGK